MTDSGGPEATTVCPERMERRRIGQPERPGPPDRGSVRSVFDDRPSTWLKRFAHGRSSERCEEDLGLRAVGVDHPHPGRQDAHTELNPEHTPCRGGPSPSMPRPQVRNSVASNSRCQKGQVPPKPTAPPRIPPVKETFDTSLGGGELGSHASVYRASIPESRQRRPCTAPPKWAERRLGGTRSLCP